MKCPPRTRGYRVKKEVSPRTASLEPKSMVFGGCSKSREKRTPSGVCIGCTPVRVTFSTCACSSLGRSPGAKEASPRFDVEMETYKAACKALGLLQDDGELDGMMIDATSTQMLKALRQRFIYLQLSNGFLFKGFKFVKLLKSGETLRTYPCASHPARVPRRSWRRVGAALCLTAFVWRPTTAPSFLTLVDLTSLCARVGTRVAKTRTHAYARAHTHTRAHAHTRRALLTLSILVLFPESTPPPKRTKEVLIFFYFRPDNPYL